MPATDDDYSSFLGGETDLREILQLLCSSSSSDVSTSSYSTYSLDDFPQAQSLAVEPMDLAHFEFGYDDIYLELPRDMPERELQQGGDEPWVATSQLHEQRCKQVEELGIHLGISNSLAVPIRTHSSYPILDTTLRTELVAIYFDHIHPLCPIIDEQNFWWHFNALSEDEFSDTFPAIMYHAMLFAAFAHATERQVQRAGCSSVHEVQWQYFQTLSRKYDDARTQASCNMDEIVLAKTSLLLSMWCPAKREIAANSLWVDRAMYHTNRSLRSKSPDSISESMPKRSDILLWCCATRKVFISYASRRPFTLSLGEEPLCDPEDVRAEFDRELAFHNFCSPAAKASMVEDFVTMCKLSQNLRNVLFMQRTTLLTMQDLEESRTASQTNDMKLHDCVSRYLKAAEVEAELKDLIERHEDIKNTKYDGLGDYGSETGSQIIAARMRSYVLQVITYSSIASLYQSTISTQPDAWARSCYRTALTRLLDASEMVACIVEHMLCDVPTEVIPGTLLVWTTLPLLPLLVEQTCSKFGLPGLSTSDSSDSTSESASRADMSLSHTQDIGSLLELTSRLAPRFDSAQETWTLLQNADHVLSLEAATISLDHVRQALTTRLDPLACQINVANTSQGWDLLTKVTKFIQNESVDFN